MTAEPVPVGQPERPDLVLVRECGHCPVELVEIRDRSGRPVHFPAERVDDRVRARRVADGDWWMARFVRGRTVQWRVVRPEPGEDPPVPEIRLAEHQCQAGAERLLADRLAAYEVSPLAAAAGAVSYGAEAGWCGGGCGTAVRRCGPKAEVLCGPCRVVLETWRRSPGPHRGSIPYGQLIDGVYVHRV